jgi:hypothetical protein
MVKYEDIDPVSKEMWKIEFYKHRERIRKQQQELKEFDSYNPNGFVQI